MTTPERRYRVEVEVIELRMGAFFPEVRRLMDLSTQQPLLEMHSYGLMHETWRADNQAVTLDIMHVTDSHARLDVTLDIPARVCTIHAPPRGSSRPGRPVNVPFEKLMDWLMDWQQGKIVILPLSNDR